MKPILRALLCLLLLGVVSVALLEIRLRTVSDSLQGSPAPGPGNALRILALGDSITHGGLKEASYPFLLKPILEREVESVEIWNLGITGAETSDLYQRIQPWLEQYKPHVVITMIGASDRNSEVPGLSYLLHHFRTARLLEVSWKTWRTSLATSWRTHLATSWSGGEKRDPLGELFDAYLQSGKDDVDYIRTLHDPLMAAERIKVAERLHRRLLLKFPQHEHARLSLGLVRAKMGQAEDAEQLFRSVIRDNEKKESPTLHWAYFCLASLLAEVEREKELEALLRTLIGRYAWNELLYEHMAVLYRKQSRSNELQRLLEEGIAKAKNPDRLHMMLARFFRETGHPKEAEAQERQVREIWEKNLQGGRTAPVYRALSASIVSSGAIHLAMQYPVLEMKPLEEILGSASGDFSYVSNENFREALVGRQYSSLFLDDFGGLYGHLTKVGAELMARNVAAALLPMLRERSLAPSQ